MNRTDRLREVLRLEGIAAAANIKASEHRNALAEDARAEFKREGTAPTWRMQDLATISLPVSKDSVYVSDQAALLAWCEERYAHQVEHIERVHPAFVSALLGQVEITDAGVFDPKTGEVVPGLDWRQGGQPRALTIRTTPDVAAIFAALGARLLDDMLAPSDEPQGHVDMADLP